MVIPKLPNSENGRLRRDGSMFPNQTQILQNRKFRFIPVNTRFPAENMKTHMVLCNTVATRASWLRFQRFANSKDNLSEVCQTFCRLEQKVRQAFQTCQTCRFLNWGINQAQVSSLPSLMFSELVPIKHTLCLILHAANHGEKTKAIHNLLCYLTLSDSVFLVYDFCI